MTDPDSYQAIAANVIESTNFYSALAAGLLWARCFHWKRDATSATADVITALQWMFAAGALRHTWFAMSRFFSHPGAFWDGYMFAARPYAVVFTSLMLTYGIIKLWSNLENHPLTVQIAVSFMLALVAFSIGFY